LPIKQIPPHSREYSAGLQDDFAPGQTSRTDVLLAMGEPDSVSTDESILTYRWQTIDGIIVVTQCTPPIEVTSETTLTLTFDKDGVLQDIDIASS
jgi:outer membrane protein assembly factor BamE (lipoprotein component of BamABCDE complex)